MNEEAISKGPVSFLRRNQVPSWHEEHAGILTMPTYDAEAALQTGAAYRHDGSLILESLRPARLGHWRHVDPVSISPLDHDHIPFMEGAIFGGHFFNMWGHFLFETVPTALVAPELPNYPVVFAPFAPDAPERFAAVWENFKPILAAAGWNDRAMMLQSAPLRAHRLIVPERLSVFGLPNGHASLWPGVSDVYRRIQHVLGRRDGPGMPMVARRPDWTIRLHPSEHALYDMLAERGCQIHDVAAMTAVQQAEVFPNATALIGFSGSNLHNSVLCPPGIPVIEIGDRRSYNAQPGDRINPTQSAMSLLMDQQPIFVDSFAENDEGVFLPFSAPRIADLVMAAVAG